MHTYKNNITQSHTISPAQTNKQPSTTAKKDILSMIIIVTLVIVAEWTIFSWTASPHKRMKTKAIEDALYEKLLLTEQKLKLENMNYFLQTSGVKLRAVHTAAEKAQAQIKDNLIIECNDLKDRVTLIEWNKQKAIARIDQQEAKIDRDEYTTYKRDQESKRSSQNLDPNARELDPTKRYPNHTTT